MKGVLTKPTPKQKALPYKFSQLEADWLKLRRSKITDFEKSPETGISIDYFPNALPIMARNPRENLIITFHVGFVFGKKWI